MKRDYRVGSQDIQGHSVLLVLGRTDSAVVYTVANPDTGRAELRWEHNWSPVELARMTPTLRRAEQLRSRIARELPGAAADYAQALLGTCLFEALRSDHSPPGAGPFRPLEDYLALPAAGASADPVAEPSHPVRGVHRLGWLGWVAVGGLLLLLAVVVLARTDAWLDSRESAKLTVVHESAEAEELVVLVRGFAGGLRTLEGVVGAVHEQLPEADIVFFNHPTHVFSNADPVILASQLEEAIAQRDHEKKYRRIILSGYSMGALLVRKAYLYGCGSVEDLRIAGAVATTRPPREWVKKVDRFVLLAGMNRGWNPDGHLNDLNSFAAGLRRLGLWVARLSGTGDYLRSFRRGEPFVANLRLQWLATMDRSRAGTNGLPIPVVVQVLGDEDEVVSGDDSRDLRAAQDFLWVRVNHTGHSDLMQLGDSGDGLGRKRKIMSAFGSDDHLLKLRRANPVAATDADTNVTHVVFVLHGIRDMGAWTSEFLRPLEEGFAQLHPGEREKIYVHRAAYGYFPMGDFLLFGDRQKNVRWFMDQVTELQARFPNLKEIDFIGHSNGTHVLASALGKYQTLKVGRVVFAGSVVRRDFPWSQFVGRVSQVRNYVGSTDWVVALFPKLFELPAFRFLNPDLGSAGFDGFEDGTVKNGETQFILGGHRAALDPRNIPSIVAFILRGERVDVPELTVPKHPLWLDLLSRVCWIVWLALFAGVGWVGWKLPVWILGRTHWRWGRSWVSYGSLSVLLRIGYAALIWLLLITV